MFEKYSLCIASTLLIFLDSMTAICELTQIILSKAFLANVMLISTYSKPCYHHIFCAEVKGYCCEWITTFFNLNEVRDSFFYKQWYREVLLNPLYHEFSAKVLCVFRYLVFSATPTMWYAYACIYFEEWYSSLKQTFFYIYIRKMNRNLRIQP